MTDNEALNKIVELRHQLHRCPELSLKEEQTKRRLEAFLRCHTSFRITERGSWFYAVREGLPTGRVLAFRADMDALPIPEGDVLPYCSQNPGISHRCGHDGHCAALAGLALELERYGCDNTIYLIFQHGEEIGAGGRECASLIEEKGIERVYAFHNWSGFPRGSVILRNGTAQCASKGLVAAFTGRTAHASQPEDGINPCFVLSRLALFTEEITQAPLYEGPVWATIVGLTAGTEDFGIAASSGRLAMTLRAEKNGDLERLSRAITEKAAAFADREGLLVSFQERDVFPDTVNHSREIRRVREAALRLGLPVIEKKEPFRASEDFGYYLRHCPGAMIYIGNGEDYPAIHTTEYDFPDEILKTAVVLFSSLAREKD